MLKRLSIAVIFALVLSLAAAAPILLVPSTSGDLTNPGILNPHQPIVIIDNAGFNASNGVVGGSGTSGDPFILKDWSIKTQTGTGISISGTDVYFIIRNCWVYNGTSTANDCVKFDDVKNGNVQNCRFENSARGIYLFDCSDINVSSASFKNLDSGISFERTQS